MSPLFLVLVLVIHYFARPSLTTPCTHLIQDPSLNSSTLNLTSHSLRANPPQCTEPYDETYIKSVTESARGALINLVSYLDALPKERISIGPRPGAFNLPNPTLFISCE